MPADDSGNARLELEALNAELEEKVEELARANLALYETARAKSEFVANMSHELRTPLNSIIGFADVLLSEMRDSAPEEQVRYVRNIRKAGYRLLELLSELLNFARLESGSVRLSSGPVFVPGLISEVISQLESAGRCVEIAADVNSGMPTVITDEVKLSQILTNLASNAVKFTSPGGRVTISAHLDEKTLVFSVKDTGPGIDEAEREKIWRRFRQGSAGPARTHEGLGLGLYIAKALTDLLGGEISLESRKGQGATFTVSVPVALVEM